MPPQRPGIYKDGRKIDGAEVGAAPTQATPVPEGKAVVCVRLGAADAVGKAGMSGGGDPHSGRSAAIAREQRRAQRQEPPPVALRPIC